MSRFRGAVVVSHAQAGADELYPEMMDRLNELHASGEHIQGGWIECQCVGAVAQEAVDTLAREKFGSGARSRWAAFVAAFPEHAALPYNDKWQTERNPPYQRDLHAFLGQLAEFKRRAFAEHPDRAKPDPSHKQCGGTGKYVEEGQEGRDGLFLYASEAIRGRGTIAELVSQPPFALFLPDGTGAVSDLPETWKQFGGTWPAAVRAMLAPHHELAYVEIDFKD